jgi:uncharacterized membrane protein
MTRKILGIMFLLLSIIMIAVGFSSTTRLTNDVLGNAEIVAVSDNAYTLELRDGRQVESTYSDDGSLWEVGDAVIVTESSLEGVTSYIIEESVRMPVFIALFVVFSVLVLLVARLAGMYSLLSLFFTVVTVLFGFVPLLLAGYSPLLIMLGLGSLLMAGIVLLSHGVTRKSLVALFSILGTLFVAVGLAYIAVGFGSITGLQDESLRFLLFDRPELDVVGILIAAMILGLLGILDDVAVSQASVVFELDKANAKYSFWELYRSASVVGRDHIVSTVNTLALAYIGASFPLILLVFAGGFTDLYYVLQFEVLAVELIRILIGSIGIVLCIPFTTLLTCLVIKQSWFKNIDEGARHVCAHHNH